MDSIRLWLALFVYFSHFGCVPVAGWIGRGSLICELVSGAANNFFDGAAAVIGFFVVSGLCIHYPYRKREKIPLRQFYARRYIRILLPTCAAIALAALFGHDLLGFYQAILWSLIAELIYYTLYPALRRLWRLSGWRVMFLAAYLSSIAILASNIRAMNFHEFGPQLTWVVGLPAWLLGCYLGEGLEGLDAAPKARIWIWRMMMAVLGAAASGLRFHAGIGYPITLTLLAPLLYLWLKRELAHSALHKPVRAFEYGGQFSYSIYLVHGMAVGVLGSLNAYWLRADSMPAGFARLAFAVTLSYLFFRFVERPSHALARHVADRLRPAAA